MWALWGGIKGNHWTWASQLQCWREQGLRLFSTEGYFVLWSVLFKPGHGDLTSCTSERGNATIISCFFSVNPEVSFCWSAGMISELKSCCFFWELQGLQFQKCFATKKVLSFLGAFNSPTEAVLLALSLLQCLRQAGLTAWPNPSEEEG